MNTLKLFDAIYGLDVGTILRIETLGWDVMTIQRNDEPAMRIDDETTDSVYILRDYKVIHNAGEVCIIQEEPDMRLTLYADCITGLSTYPAPKEVLRS